MNPVPGSPLTLDIPSDVLAESADGTYQLSYFSRHFVGGTPNESPSIPIIIDRTPPGGEALAPMVFPTEAHDSLSAAELVSLGNQLVGGVPSYFDIKWGDVIRTYWGDQPGPVHRVLAEEVEQPMIPVAFDRTFLDNLADGPVAVTYTVTDRAGNLSVVSSAALLVLQLHNNPADLLAPRVPQAADGLVDNADGRQGVRVDVPAFTHAQAGDAITVLWGALRLPEQTLEESVLGQPVLCSATVAYASLAAVGDGPIVVQYEVHRGGNLLATSPTLTVRVFLTLPGPQDDSPQTLVTEALAAPIIKGKSDNPNRQDNVLDADDYLLSADALIAWREQFQACDQINLFWGSGNEPVVRLINQNDVQAATTLVISVPNSRVIAQGACKPVPVHYTVTHAGNPNTSYSPSQWVQLISPCHLPGGGYGLPAPIFTQVNACNTLEPSGSPDGTQVQVKPYREMHVGDQVTLSFKGFDALAEGAPITAATFSQSMTVDDDAMLKGCRFRVDAAALQAIHLGRAEARYEVTHASGRVISQKADAYVDMRTPAASCQAFNYPKG
ncbi:hypothetical protein [Pseudomonas sp. DWP3-1-2]|uniref:hypothetical protein n=1 Tax=Pseudomonas sp. DWP3-1-2 TaxID=2804645 RepID=UPI003CF39149